MSLKYYFALGFFLIPNLAHSQHLNPDSIIQVGSSLESAGDYDTAIEIYTELIVRLEELKGYEETLAELNDKLGYYYSSVEQNFKLAEQYFLSSLELRKNDIKRSWKSYYNLASIYVQQEDRQKTQFYLKPILTLDNNEFINKTSLAYIHFMAGINYKSFFRSNRIRQFYDSSLFYLNQCQKLIGDSNSPIFLTSQLEKADLFNSNNHPEDAIEILQKLDESFKNTTRFNLITKEAFAMNRQYDSAFFYSDKENIILRNRLSNNNIESVAKVTEDYRTDKQLDQAEETAFLASQKAKTYGIVVIILLLVLAISYLIFLQTIQRKKLENLQAVVLGEEKERKRLAKDLHDGIGVLLTSIRMRLSSFEDKVDDQKAYHDSLEQIDDACSEVRRVSHNLSPASLEKLGLNEALHDLADQVNLSGNMRMVEQIKLPERLLSEEEEVLVYRIVQELINNSLKYAEANELTLSLKQEASDMKLHYRDNGKGFDKENVKPGIGLKSIASRIDILKGKMSFQSQLGKGTEYEISIPING